MDFTSLSVMEPAVSIFFTLSLFLFYSKNIQQKKKGFIVKSICSYSSWILDDLIGWWRPINSIAIFMGGRKNQTTGAGRQFVNRCHNNGFATMHINACTFIYVYTSAANLLISGGGFHWCTFNDSFLLVAKADRCG